MFDVGLSVSYGEAVALTRAALADTSTPLGAEVAGWKYPASFVDVFLMAGLYGDKIWTVGPFDRAALQDRPRPDDTTEAELAAAIAELEANITFGG